MPLPQDRQNSTRAQVTLDLTSYMQQRGISRDTAAARGCRMVLPGEPPKASGEGNSPEFDPRDFAATYGFTRTFSGILVPLLPIADTDAYQLRRHSGDPKWVSPKGQPNRLSTHPYTRDKVLHSDEDLWLVEGVTRVDALAELGIPAVGITGAWSFKTRAGRSSQILSEFELVPLKNRRVVICLDGDWRTNPSVNAAVKYLQAFLENRGVEDIRIISVPNGIGLDDYLGGGGGLRELPSSAWEPVTLHSAVQRAVQRVEDEHRQRALETWHNPANHSPAGDALRMLIEGGNKFIFTDSRHGYTPYLLADTRFRSDHDTIEAFAYGIADSHRMLIPIGRGLKHIEKLAEPRGLSNARSMLWPVASQNRSTLSFSVVSEPDMNAPEWLAVGNGLVHLPTRTICTDDNAAHSALATHGTDIPYQHGEWQNNDTIKTLIQHLDNELFTDLMRTLGCLLYGNSQDALVILIGPPRCGKGTMLAGISSSLQDYAGDASRTTAITGVRASGHNEQDAVLYHARIAVVDEVGGKIEQKQAARRLKDLSGGAEGSYSLKMEHEVRARVSATLVMTANASDIPKLGFDDPAIASRTRIFTLPPLACPACGARCGVDASGINAALHATVTGEQCPHGGRPVADVSLRESLRLDENAAAFLSALIDHAPNIPELPPESAQSAAAKRIRSAIDESDIDRFVRLHLERGRPDERVLCKEAWLLWCTANESLVDGAAPGVNSRVAGVYAKTLYKRISEIVEIPTNHKFDVVTRATARGWWGVRLAPDRPDMTLDAAKAASVTYTHAHAREVEKATFASYSVMPGDEPTTPDDSWMR